MVQMARQREEENPRSVERDMMLARRRRASEKTARTSVRRSWMKAAAVGMMFYSSCVS